MLTSIEALEYPKRCEAEAEDKNQDTQNGQDFSPRRELLWLKHGRMIHLDQEDDEQAPDKPAGISKTPQQLLVVLRQHCNRNYAQQ